jgi:hypothetical protein
MGARGCEGPMGKIALATVTAQVTVAVANGQDRMAEDTR